MALLFFWCCRRVCCNTWGCVSQRNIWLVTNLVRNVLAHSFVKACEPISGVTYSFSCFNTQLSKTAQLFWNEPYDISSLSLLSFFLLAGELFHVNWPKYICCLNFFFFASIPKCFSQSLSINGNQLSSCTSVFFTLRKIEGGTCSLFPFSGQVSPLLNTGGQTCSGEQLTKIFRDRCLL